MWGSKWGYEKLYEAAKSERKKSDLEKKLRNSQFALLAVLIGWFFTARWAFLYCYGLALIQKNTHPLLSGAPQIALLALIIGLSAYLRQVRSSAVEQRDKIASGDVWNYPLNGERQELTKMKLKLLDGIATDLLVASPLLIFLFLVIALRVFFDAYTQIIPVANSSAILEAADVVILGWATLVFVFLGGIHFVSRVRDDRIRAVSRTFEAEFREGKTKKDAVQLPQEFLAEEPVEP